jgi:hypothetical protein
VRVKVAKFNAEIASLFVTLGFVGADIRKSKISYDVQLTPFDA